MSKNDKYKPPPASVKLGSNDYAGPSNPTLNSSASSATSLIKMPSSEASTSLPAAPVVAHKPPISKDVNNNNNNNSSRPVSIPTSKLPASNESAKIKENDWDSQSAASSCSSSTSALTTIQAHQTEIDEYLKQLDLEEAMEKQTAEEEKNQEFESSDGANDYSLIDMNRKKRRLNKLTSGESVEPDPEEEECQLVTENVDDDYTNSSSDDTYMALIYPKIKSPGKCQSNDKYPTPMSGAQKPNASNLESSKAVPKPQSTASSAIVFCYSPPISAALNQSAHYYDDLEEQEAKNKKHFLNVDYICESCESVSEYKHQWIIENLNPDFYEVGEQIESQLFPEHSAEKAAEQEDTSASLDNDDLAFTFKLYPNYPPSTAGPKFALTICFRSDLNKHRLLHQVHKLVFKVGFKILNENKELIFSQPIKTFSIDLTKENEIPVKQFESEIARVIFKHFYSNDGQGCDEALWYMSEPDQREKSRDIYFVFDTVFLKETTENPNEKASKASETFKLGAASHQQLPDESQCQANVAKIRVHGTHKSFESGHGNPEVTEIKSIKFLWHLENYPSMLADLKETKSMAKPPLWIQSSFVSWKKKAESYADWCSKDQRHEVNSEHKWRLCLYPKGKDERYAGNMSIFMKQVRGPEVKVVVEFILLNPQGKEISIMRLPPVNLATGKRWGVGEYLKISNMEDLRPNAGGFESFLDPFSVVPLTKAKDLKSDYLGKNKGDNSVRFNMVCRLKIVSRRTIFEPIDKNQHRIKMLFGDQLDKPLARGKRSEGAVDNDRQTSIQQARVKYLYENFYKLSKHCDMVFRLKLSAADCQRLCNGELDGVVDNGDGVEILRKNLRSNINQPVFVDFLVHKLVLSLSSLILDEHIREFNEACRSKRMTMEQIIQQQLLETPPPSVLAQNSLMVPFPAVLVPTSFNALNKFIKYLYTQQLDLSDSYFKRKNKSASPMRLHCCAASSGQDTAEQALVRGPSREQQDQQDEIYRLNLLFELYELALRFEVKELLDEIEDRSRELIKLNYIVCWLDRLADLMTKIQEEQTALKSASLSKIHTRYALVESKLVFFRSFKSIIMKFFIKNLNLILKTRKDFLNVEFKLNDRRQLIYDEIWKHTSS